MTDDRSGDLVLRWQQGDQQAAAELFHRYRNRLVALARMHLSTPLARRVDAEDIVQSVYRIFFTGTRDGRYDFRQGGELWQLLVTMTLNKLRDQTRQNARQKRALQRERELDDANGADDLKDSVFARSPSPLEVTALADEVEQLMRTLNPIERQVLEMRLQGHSLAEITVQVGRSIRTVCRALERIKEHLEARERCGSNDVLGPGE
jgi:RNA polymerase sigma factor (sigma-70 family)